MRRFPPPWTVEEHNNACFIVRDGLPKFKDLPSELGGSGERLAD